MLYGDLLDHDFLHCFRIGVLLSSVWRLFGTHRKDRDFQRSRARDLVDLTWDAFRLRRLKASVMTTNAHKGLSETLAPLVGGSDAQTLAEAWAARQSDVVEQVDKALGTAGLNMDAVMAQTLCLKLDEIERIDRMIAISEARRNTTLREIDRHRETLGQKLRRAMEQLEDRQLRMIESPSIDGTNAE
jgi:hypothetical protein